MYARLRPLIFRAEAERAHTITLRLLELAGAFSWGRGLLRQASGDRAPNAPVEVFGLTFPNRLGLAAGYDKDGRALWGLAGLGFGHIEIGTITPRPQEGNARPRIFRLVEDEALINRMGFPNKGVKAAQARLARKRPSGVVIGVNLGKGLDTPLEAAGRDYAELILVLGPLADYLAVNVSSPNTPGLREMQGRRRLEALLAELGVARASLSRRIPVLVKLAPDLSSADLAEAVEIIEAAGMDGVIAANTTLARDELHSPSGSEAGGLSGRPLFARALEAVEQTAHAVRGRLPIVAAGGIMGAREAQAMRNAGAALVQVYTGLVYRGPGLVGEILGALR
jgi:dihydroorotate dehydrogenase